MRCSQNGFLGFDGGPDVTRRLFIHPFAAGVGDSQDEVSKMKKKIAVRTAIASAVIAPAMVFAGGGTATAVPALTAGATGEVTVTVPAGESWTCFGFDSEFNFKTGAFATGVGKLSGFAKGNATVFCFGNQAPFFFNGSVTVK